MGCMLTPCTRRIAALAVATTLVLVAIAPAADGPRPVVTLTGAISPKGRIRTHTPLTIEIGTSFKSVPPGGNFVLQSFDYLFPKGAVTNGRLFPSCSARKLKAAHGVLGMCPKGSKIGSGVATGIAVAIGVKSHGNLTLFNGPGGKSVTMNVDIEHPAIINETWSAPLVRLHGKYVLKLSAKVPDSLKTIIGGDIVVTKIDVTVGATRIVKGVQRGYTEAVNCPRNRKAPFHADFTFNQGAKASADATIAC
jgi:hypothetical protein